MAIKTKIVQPGGLNKRLIATIQAAVKSAEIATTCDWLIDQGYAYDVTHVRELVSSALNA